MAERRHLQGPGTGRDLEGPDRARRVVPGPSRRRPLSRHYPRALPPATPSTAGGPVAVLPGFLRTLLAPWVGGWVVLPRYTHPVHPSGPQYTMPGRVRTCTGTPPDTARTCTFRPVVGEPRGVEYRGVLGPRLVIYSYLRDRGITRPFDWFYDCFFHRFY